MHYSYARNVMPIYGTRKELTRTKDPPIVHFICVVVMVKFNYQL